jgi:hypothetical protein
VDDTEFWSILEDAYAKAEGNPLRSVKFVKDRLRTLRAEDIERFQAILDEKMSLMETWDFVNAMAIIQGDASDDLFEDWRAGLLLKGKSVFEAALVDVESLASGARIQPCERLLYAAVQIWDRLYPDRSMTMVQSKSRLDGSNPVQTVEQLKSRYPKLTKSFWGTWTEYSPYREKGLAN